jgi:hypothetical protein
MAIISACLFHQQSHNFEKGEHENAQGGRDLLMSSASVCCKPLEPPANLWTPTTKGQVCIGSPQCEVCVSNVTCVSSLWAKMSCSNECASKSNSNISSMMSQSVRFLLVAILLNALQPNSAHTKPNTFRLIVIQAPALPGRLHVIALTWNGLKC